MTPADYKKLGTDCDELALKYFEHSDDLAWVSFHLKQVIKNRLEFLAEIGQRGRLSDETTD